MNPSLSTARQVWQTFWRARAARERRLMLLAAWVIAAALAWQVAVAPALHTWQEAPARQAALDAQTGQMLQLQAQARRMQSTGELSRSAALQLLESSAAQWLGPQARLSLQGEQVRITLQAAPAEGLSRWLAQARTQAQALPVQAQLQRSTASAGSPVTAASAPAPGSDTAVLWRGTLVLNLR